MLALCTAGMETWAHNSMWGSGKIMHTSAPTHSVEMVNHQSCTRVLVLSTVLLLHYGPRPCHLEATCGWCLSLPRCHVDCRLSGASCTGSLHARFWVHLMHCSHFAVLVDAAVQLCHLHIPLSPHFPCNLFFFNACGCEGDTQDYEIFLSPGSTKLHIKNCLRWLSILPKVFPEKVHESMQGI